MSDLINRQTLLAQMNAQKVSYMIEVSEGKTDLVEPSWELATSMINDMQADCECYVSGAAKLADYLKTTHLTIDEALQKIKDDAYENND